MVTSETVVQTLREVMDPEAQMNVVDLGLIKDIAVAEERISVRMVLTVPGCPLARYLLHEVQASVGKVAEGRQVEVQLVDEPWTPPWAPGGRGRGNASF